MNKKKERHILGLSGGKDSAALAVYMKEKHPELDLEYVFTDSGHELPETYLYLKKIRALLNIKIITIRPEKDFDYWLKYFNGVLPSPNNRWCTRLLKLKPYDKWLKNNCKDQIVYNYVGIRADEDREGFREQSNFFPKYPFVEDGHGLEEIIKILGDSGLGLPGYYSWRKRSGCFFCFYQKDSEWLGLKKKHRTLFNKACEYEENHSDNRKYTWREKGFLKKLKKTDLNNYEHESCFNGKNKNLLSETLSSILDNSQDINNIIFR
ncbi:MAG: phosphoadenosine phosphosulfate reductase family protein [Desulforegulaceae bacterium]|nr:phosphoadenosine phosphosulfate reductase family protein [Desulforegulaceae bacterium]